MFDRLRSITVLFGIVLAGTPFGGNGALAQELSVEIPVLGGGKDTDLTQKRSSAPAELPKASGFEELSAPDEPVVPFVEDDSEPVVEPPPAKLVEPTPAEPKAKAATKPKAVKKPKAAAKPKPVVQPKAAAKPKPAALPKADAQPKALVKPKLAIPLPRVKPQSIAAPAIAAKKTTTPKTAKTDPAPSEDIPFVGVEVAPQVEQPTPLPREKPKSILAPPVVAKKTVPTKAAKADPIITEEAPFVDVDSAPQILQPTPLPREKPTSILAPALAAKPTTPTKAAKADPILTPDPSLTQDDPFVDVNAAPPIEPPVLEIDPFKTPPVVPETTELGEPTELVKFKTGPIVQLPEVSSGPIAPVSTAQPQPQDAPKLPKGSKADRIDRN